MCLHFGHIILVVDHSLKVIQEVQADELAEPKGSCGCANIPCHIPLISMRHPSVLGCSTLDRGRNPGNQEKSNALSPNSIKSAAYAVDSQVMYDGALLDVDTYGTRMDEICRPCACVPAFPHVFALLLLAAPKLACQSLHRKRMSAAGSQALLPSTVMNFCSFVCWQEQLRMHDVSPRSGIKNRWHVQ